MGQNLYAKTHEFFDWCAEIPTRKFCNKVDSGAPLICNKDGNARLYGMILDSLSGDFSFTETSMISKLNNICSIFQVTGKSCRNAPVLSTEVQDFSSFTYCVLRSSEKKAIKASTTSKTSITTLKTSKTTTMKTSTTTLKMSTTTILENSTTTTLETSTTTVKSTTTPKIVITSEGNNHAIKSRHDPFLEMLLFIIFSYFLLGDYMY